MSFEVEGDIVVCDGDHKIDVAEQEVPLIRHMIRRLRGQLEWLPRGQGKSMDDIRNVLNGGHRGIGLLKGLLGS
jgi:hypothetical protein